MRCTRIVVALLTPALAASLAVLVLVGASGAATPTGGNLKPAKKGAGAVSWKGQVGSGSGQCFGGDGRPDASSGCDSYALTVALPAGYHATYLGKVVVSISNFGSSDVDLYVYDRNEDGTVGDFVDASATSKPTESVTLPAINHRYYVTAIPVDAVPSNQAYKGTAVLSAKQHLLSRTNAKAPPGFINYRASHDRFNSHSEPSIAMDPLNHKHLIAGSKQYENLAHYLFKIGTYESYDGGRRWNDLGQLPGYCQAPGQCDPKNQAKYRTTSDVATAFDDEGNAYANVLDAPGGTFAFEGFNMTVHIKKPGKPWSNPITVHDNRGNSLTATALLDDKNWLGVDNVTDVNGGPNKRHDGKIGTLYICWSLDQALAPAGLGVGQQIVLERSTDGGHTWGGIVPGDNLPLSLSQKGVVSGIGCHIDIGPAGKVYVTWYDNQLSSLMQVVSTDRGHTFTPARPIAMLTGNDSAYPGEGFRNLSIPSAAVDAKGNLYVVASVRNGSPPPAISPEVADQAEKLGESGHLTRQALVELIKAAGGSVSNEQESGGGEGCPSGDNEKEPCADIYLWRSTDGGSSYLDPVRVNQDPVKSAADQFQPWMAVTPKGQVDVSYFDRRNDSKNFFIDTYLSRSNDGGQHFTDTRVTQRLWDPERNPPISVSGEFIGDYQGLVADDKVAIPFWNDTQWSQLPHKAKQYSPWQEVSDARVPNTPATWITGAGRTRRVSGGSVVVRGRAGDPSGGKLRRVQVAVRRGRHGRLHFVKAHGLGHWRLAISGLSGGTYTVISRAVNTSHVTETEREPGRNVAKLIVR